MGGHPLRSGKERFCVILSLIRRAAAAVKCRLCLPWSAIHPVDKSLILFMALLLGQSAYTLFHPSGGQAARDIDVIIRTASSAIFGYFLSANFATGQSAAPSGAQPRTISTADGETVPSLTGRIGFLSRPSGPETGGAASSGGQAEGAFCLQVAAATGIGLFCLAALMVLRNTAGPDAADSAVAVQFRDFVSGCVGFLIGSPTHPPRTG